MSACDQVVTYFDAEKTLGTRLYEIWNKAHAVQSLPKLAIYDNSWGKKENTTKTEKQQQSMSSSTWEMGLIGFSLRFIIFSLGESQGQTNGKL